MGKVRFWKLQHTDEFGMPCPTRIRITGAERKEAEQPDAQSWSLKKWNPEQSQTGIARATPPPK